MRESMEIEPEIDNGHHIQSYIPKSKIEVENRRSKRDKISFHKKQLDKIYEARKKIETMQESYNVPRTAIPDEIVRVADQSAQEHEEILRNIQNKNQGFMKKIHQFFLSL